MAESQRLFDTTKTFSVPIISGGEKRCILRFPTDEQWTNRARRQKVVTYDLGRGKARTDFDEATVERQNMELFDAIRVDKDGPPFDPAEAAAAILKLERSEVLEAEPEGDGYRVVLKALGCVTTHRVKTPLASDLLEFRRHYSRFTVDRRRTEKVVNCDVAGGLYDRIKISVEGYAGAVPITHKADVLAEVINQVTVMEDIAEPEVASPEV